MPDFVLEDAARAAGLGPICGVDEAGRGPWAGPVVAAAVILDRDAMDTSLIEAINDSKRLSASERERLYTELEAQADIGVGCAGVQEIDTYNILQATFLAMGRAVEDLDQPPAVALVDGNQSPPLDGCEVRTVVKGDGRSLSIAAASIVAKVTRDRIMDGLAERFPGYGWETNAGYGTKQHKDALERLGVTPQHRHSYRPILNILRSLRGPGADV